MEITYEGSIEGLDEFLAEHQYEDVVIKFTLTEEQVAALDREVEVRTYEYPVVARLGEGTTVVTQATADRQVIVGLPEPEPEEVEPEAPVEEGGGDEHTS